MKKSDCGEAYLNSYPKLRKWINECQCCHIKGYKPNMPDKITIVDGSKEVYFIKKYFKPLELNEDGLCETCAKFFSKERLKNLAYKIAKFLIIV